MPELPEVEVVRAGLEPAVAGAVVAGVEVLEARSLRRHVAGAADFEARLTGRRIQAVVRRGKFLWLPLEPSIPRGAQDAVGADPGRRDDAGSERRGDAAPGRHGDADSARRGDAEAVLAHLGMSGQLLLRAPDADPDRQLRVRLHLEHPDHGHLVVAFADQRIFGSLAIDRLQPTADGAAGGLGSAAALVPGQVAHIARDPLDPAFDDDRFTAALARRRTGIKRALLDQTLVSGIGNIYADEALWAARLHFDAPTDRLPRRRARELLAEVRLVLERALAEGGTSFDAQHVNVNGASGYFSHSLRAYGQEGRPCLRCGTPIVREAFMNRSSHRCPRCQRRPRAA